MMDLVRSFAYVNAGKLNPPIKFDSRCTKTFKHTMHDQRHNRVEIPVARLIALGPKVAAAVHIPVWKRLCKFVGVTHVHCRPHLKQKYPTDN